MVKSLEISGFPMCKPREKECYYTRFTPKNEKILQSMLYTEMVQGIFYANEVYRLTGIIKQDGIIYSILTIMNATGSIVFDNLALLLAMGVFGEIIMKKQSLLTAR